MYVELLIRGTPLDPQGSKEEQEKHFEIQRLARQEAKEERAKKKQAASKSESQ
jgi:hypothetical protein